MSKIFFSIEIDECLPAPCENNGTCTDLLNGYNCTCDTGYEGDTCADSKYTCTSKSSIWWLD